ncbi:unnamed protein product [Penicillium salamii]|uniref:DUF1776-domain-containing protein n=1 Tax=Penicillium salamii TaxID=1612424 RepID=A0A9W4NHF9_9EURO|nr:unnamed protein product [Penicillium salamii]CAG8065557.1 unnamed protein product [Penicillium salamii]CAG8072807.1 unnamed protein product [Penicillium salamii]CAG8172620.1 unnamed protein product [Penicillium salamii]CAG8228098.1 unnamed protein product [Penicillium salamii]
MTSDDQFFFDYLASIPHDVRRYSLEVADSIDRHVDHAAKTLKDTLAQQSWLPPTIRPTRVGPRGRSSQSFTDRAQNWMARNRAWTAAIFAFIGTGVVLYYGSKKLHGKRRKAKRASNGGRKEIVVVAGSPHEPMTRAIATDLERRGYIVYVTVSSADEEQIVKSENRADIKALWLDLTTTASSPSDIHPSLQEIHSLITQPQSPLPGVPPHTCQLSGVIVVPSPNYSAGPVATIPPSSWADTVNTRLLSPILTAQAFLPLLTLRSNSSTLLFAYPSISSSLSAPYAGPEVAATRAISGFADSLRQELRLLENSNVSVVELRLGNIDLGPVFRAGQSQIAGTEVLAWSTQQRALYASQYLNSVEQRPVASAGPGTVRGSPARKLHYAILDALEPTSRNVFGQKTTKKSVMYVGRGARSYNLIGAWVPSGLVALMMGYRGNGIASDTPISGSGSETSWERV